MHRLAKVTTLPRESDVLSIWRGRQAPRFKSRRTTVRLRIMAKRSWPESMRNAALLELMQPNLEPGARRTGRYTLFGLAGGNFREIGHFVWNLLAFERRGSVGRSPAFPSFIVFSTRWKESRLNGVWMLLVQIDKQEDFISLRLFAFIWHQIIH